MVGRPATPIERRVRRLEAVFGQLCYRRQEIRDETERARKALWAAKAQFYRETGRRWQG